MDALVLSGGGNRGAMQVGALRALFEAGVRPDLIVGSSVGAVNGAFIAGNPTVEGTAGLAEIWRKLRRQDVFPGSLADRARRLLVHRDHLYDPSRLRRLIERYARVRLLEDLPVRLVVVAAALDEGREVWFTNGPLVPAVMASAAIPGIFPPVLVDGARCVDGAVVNHAPLSVAVTLGADRVWVIDVGLPCQCKRARNILDVVMQAMALQGIQRLGVDLLLYADKAQITYIPLPCQLDAWFSDFSHTEAMMREAYRLTKSALLEPPATPPWFEGPLALERRGSSGRDI